MRDLEEQNQMHNSSLELNEHEMEKIIGGKKKHKSHGSGGEGEEGGGGDGSNPTWSDRYYANRANGQSIPKSAWHATIG